MDSNEDLWGIYWGDSSEDQVLLTADDFDTKRFHKLLCRAGITVRVPKSKKDLVLEHIGIYLRENSYDMKLPLMTGWWQDENWYFTENSNDMLSGTRPTW